MPIPVWDTAIPHKPLAGSWSMAEPYLPPSDSDMEGGNLRKRRKPGDDVATIEFKIGMSRAQAVAFRSFLKNTLFNGASRFTMSVWLGNGFETKTVQFASSFVPPINEYGLDATVNMKLKVYGV